MEEEIRNIILRGDWHDGNYETAKEITSHIMEFILWLDLECSISIMPTINYYCWTIDKNEPKDKEQEIEYSFDEIYQYWLREVKPPQS